MVKLLRLKPTKSLMSTSQKGWAQEVAAYKYPFYTSPAFNGYHFSKNAIHLMNRHMTHQYLAYSPKLKASYLYSS